MLKTIVIIEEGPSLGSIRTKPYVEEGKMRQICNTSIEFARMWGVLETLADFPNKNNIPDYIPQWNRDAIFEWAEEYALTEQTDEASYFKKKLEEL